MFSTRSAATTSHCTTQALLNYNDEQWPIETSKTIVTPLVNGNSFKQQDVISQLV